MFGQASQPRGRRARGDRAGGGLGWFGQGSAGVSAGSNLMNEAFNSMAFYAPRTSTITQTRGAGTPTETRDTVATVMGYAADAALADGQTLLTVAADELRHEGARRISEGVWSNVDADGAPIPAATLKGVVVEAAATQYLGVTGTPATQTTASLGTGTYTLWCDGAGSCIASAGTATITGESAASQDTPNTFTVTVAGTVTVTVTGALTRFNLTNTAYQTTYIENVGSVITNGAFNTNLDGWTLSATATASIPSWDAGVMKMNSDGSGFSRADQSFSTVSGTSYTLTGVVAGGTQQIAVGTSQGGTTLLSASIVAGAFQRSFTATGTTTWLRLEDGGGTASSFDNITCYAVNVRNADVLDDQVASNLTAAAGTVAFTWTPSHDPSGTIALCGSYVDASNYIVLLHDATKYILRKRIAGVNYDAELTAAFANVTSAKIAMTWGASGINLAVDGTLGTAHANTDDAQLGTRWQWGADGNGGQQAGAAFKEMYLTPRTMSDAELQAVTA